MVVYRADGWRRSRPWPPRFEGAGKLPALGNLTEGVP